MHPTFHAAAPNNARVVTKRVCASRTLQAGAEIDGQDLPCPCISSLCYVYISQNVLSQLTVAIAIPSESQ